MNNTDKEFLDGLAQYIRHCTKYTLFGFMVFFSMKLSNINFSLFSVMLLAFAVGLLEWRFKLWLVEQLVASIKVSNSGFNAILSKLDSDKV